MFIGLLGQRQPDVARRLERLKTEAARVESNETLDNIEKGRLIKEKHTAIMKPVVVAIEEMKRRTYDTPPQSPQEEDFARVYGTHNQK